MFGEVLKDDDLLADLEALEAEDAAKEMEGPVGAGAISATEVSTKVVPISMIFTLWTQKWENSEFMKLNKVGFLCKFCIT